MSFHSDQPSDFLDSLQTLGAIVFGIEGAGPRECFIELQLGPLLGAFHRTGRRLPVELSAHRLKPGRRKALSIRAISLLQAPALA
jgi:hypothetical protein